MDVRRILVVGAGTMGSGIAQVTAMAGYEALLLDAVPGAAERGLAKAQKNLAEGVARGKVSADQERETLARLRKAPDDIGESAANADLIVEAIPEDLTLKRDLFGRLGRVAPPHALLATNTSSLPIAEIAAASGRPDKVVGMHFFNPVHIMPLLELVRGRESSAESVEAAKAVGEKMGKTVIVVKDSPGFATSRLGLALGLEAIRMVEEGVASAEDIDRAMELGYRHPIGPLKLSDLVGLDVRLGIAEHLARTLDRGRFEPPSLLRRMVGEGQLGKKSGQGFYPWP